MIKRQGNHERLTSGSYFKAIVKLKNPQAIQKLPYKG